MLQRLLVEVKASQEKLEVLHATIYANQQKPDTNHEQMKAMIHARLQKMKAT
jgi:chaperonin cofactor prefoldin